MEDEELIYSEVVSHHHDHPSLVTTLLRFLEPNAKPTVTVDDDGDLILQRGPINTIKIEHHTSSSLSEVGLQIWRGAIILSEVLITRKNEIQGKIVLEMGGGIGLTSIIAARYSKTVYLTDKTSPVLDAARRNIERGECGERINLRKWDWNTKNDFVTTTLLHAPKKEEEKEEEEEEEEMEYSWKEADKEALHEVDVILAADIIYSDEITDAFFEKLRLLLWHTRKKTCYCLLAMEKRIIFSVDKMNVIEYGYQRFFYHMNRSREVHGEAEPLEGKKLDLEGMPSYFLPPHDCHGDQKKYLEVWEIRARR